MVFLNTCSVRLNVVVQEMPTPGLRCTLCQHGYPETVQHQRKASAVKRISPFMSVFCFFLYYYYLTIICSLVALTLTIKIKTASYWMFWGPLYTVCQKFIGKRRANLCLRPFTQVQANMTHSRVLWRKNPPEVHLTSYMSHVNLNNVDACVIRVSKVSLM